MPVVTLPDGREVAFPDGMTVPQMETAMREFMARSAPTRPQNMTKAAGMVGRGFNESLATTLGAPFDLAGGGYNLLARGVNAATAALGMGEPLPRVTTSYTDLARRGLQALTGPEVKPETTTEKVLFGAGRGLGDAMSVAMPAAAAGKLAAPGGVAAGVMDTLSSRPVMQGVAGAAGGAATEYTESPLAGMAASLAVPMAVSAIGRAALPVRPQMDPERQRLIAKALEEGIPLTPAQQTGSRPLRIMEGVFDTFPTTAGRQEAMRDAQGKAFNAASLAKSGTAGDVATPEVIKAAQNRIGGVINDVATRNTLNVSDDFRDLTKSFNAYADRYMTRDQAKPLKAMLDDIAKADKNFDGSIPGRTYMNIDSQLGQMTKSAEGVTKDKLAQLRQSFRAMMDDSISPQDKGAWDQARRDYANLMVTRDAASGAGEATALGNVSPAALRTALNRSGGREAYGAGFGDQNDLARIGQALLRREQDSGTAGRATMLNLLTGGAGGVGGGLITGGDPVASMAAAGSALALPKLVQQAYYSDLISNYLLKGVPRGKEIAEALPGIDRGLAAALIAGRSRSMPAPPFP